MDTSGLVASIVVPTHDRCAPLTRLLDRLEAQTIPPDRFEVVVVDDGSRDGTESLLAARSASYRFTWKSQPQRGRAAACNAGVGLASGPIVAFLDDDMEPRPEWLAGHLAIHAEAGAPDGVPVGVIGASPTVLEPGAPRAARYLAGKFDRHLAKLERGGPIGFRDVYTGNFSIRRELFVAAGRFDEDFTLYGNEDGELAIRLVRHGMRFVYAADAVAVQSQTKDLRTAFGDAVAKGRTAALLARKHPDAASDLRLARPGGFRRRAARRLLLAVSGLSVRVAPAVVGTVAFLERLDPPGLDRIYEVLFDFGYWLGVRQPVGRGIA